MRRGNRFVGGGVYAGRNPDKHGHRRIRLQPLCNTFCAQFSIRIRNEFKFVDGVHHHAPYPVFNSALNLVIRLIITVQRNILPGNLRPQGNCQFPTRCRIKTQAFFMRPPRHGGAQE